VDGVRLEERHLAFLPAGKNVEVKAQKQSRVMLLGGDRMDGRRFIWWNFVASSRERIEEAKLRWKEQRFAPVPGENEFIPLPDH
jgi:redox-sensitive bicupin YhaK (pirin superfamily)